jgi:tetratricopeptide (TPR) repeat protein
MRRLTLVILALVLSAAVVLPACQGPQSPPTSSGVKADQASQPDPLRSVPPPPGLEAKSVQPRQGDALILANLTLPQVLARIPGPDYLTSQPADPVRTAAAQDDDADGAGDDDDAVDAPRVPLTAQRAYLKARMAWREGNSFEAVRLLQQALRLAPDSAAILRLLGRIDTAGGNPQRGAQSLEQALRLEPDDPQSLFLLARYAAVQGRGDHAIAIMARALDLARAGGDLDPALPPLMQFFLGSSLEQGGYDAAAIAAYLRALDLPDSFPRSTGLLRELAFLYRQRGDAWLFIGDAHHRLGEPGAALLAYRKAADFQVNPDDLAARLTYTLLRLGHDDDAQRLVAQALQSQGATPSVLALLRYTIAHGSAAGPLLGQLRAAYVTSGRPAQIALTLADVLPPDQAVDLLAGHLQHQPADQAVFAQWLKLRLIAAALPAKPEDHPNHLAQVIRAAAGIIAAAPQTAIPYTQVLSEHLSGVADTGLMAAAWRRVQTQSTAPEYSDAAAVAPWIDLLHASWLAQQGQTDAAIALLEPLVDAHPDLRAVRLRLGEWLVRSERFTQAAKVLEPLQGSTDTLAIRLRVRVLAETGHPEQALRLLEGLLAADAGNLALVVDKANLHLKTGDSAAAERTLLDAVNASPNEEKLYEALIDLYDSQAAPPDAVRQYQRLMTRLLRVMPQSPVARVERAKLHAARGEVGPAETMLRQVLAEKPQDLRALDALLDTLARSNRKPQADALLAEHLTARPNDGRLLLLARQHFQRTGNREGFADATLKLILLQPESAQRALTLASFYAQTGRFEEGEQHLRDALTRYPQHEADLSYQRGMLLDRQGRREEAEKVMLDALSRHAEHPMLNNALGYAWADQGRNLEQAQAMIRQALESEPDRAAYLDSLGWVLYKRGQFAESEQWLQRSKAAAEGQYPVILDHLGDAQYRLDQKPQARQTWQQALGLLQRLRQTGQADDPELTGLDERLSAKLKALDANQPAPVAPVP